MVLILNIIKSTVCNNLYSPQRHEVHKVFITFSCMILCVLCAFVVIIFDRIKVKPVFIPDKKSIDAAMVLEYGACKTILNKRWNHGRG